MCVCVCVFARVRGTKASVGRITILSLTYTQKDKRGACLCVVLISRALVYISRLCGFLMFLSYVSCLYVLLICLAYMSCLYLSLMCRASCHPHVYKSASTRDRELLDFLIFIVDKFHHLIVAACRHCALLRLRRPQLLLQRSDLVLGAVQLRSNCSGFGLIRCCQRVWGLGASEKFGFGVCLGRWVWGVGRRV